MRRIAPTPSVRLASTAPGTRKTIDRRSTLRSRLEESPHDATAGEPQATNNPTIRCAATGVRNSKSQRSALGKVLERHESPSSGVARLVAPGTQRNQTPVNRPPASGEWRRPGSNRQPPPCTGGALPIELRPRDANERCAAPCRKKRGSRRSRRGPRYFAPTAKRRMPTNGAVFEMRAPRFELGTSALSGLRSNQLSYARRTDRREGPSTAQPRGARPGLLFGGTKNCKTWTRLAEAPSDGFQPAACSRKRSSPANSLRRLRPAPPAAGSTGGARST